MKTLFFIAALLGAVYLILQTPAGKAWLEDSDPEVHIQQEIIKKQQTNNQIDSQVLLAVEKKMTELTQRLSQKQQTEINQLEQRIGELENELIMSRVAKKKLKSVSSSGVTLHPYKQPAEKLVALSSMQASMQSSMQASTKVPTQTSTQGLELGEHRPETLAVTSDKQLQRKRQARLQDIAQKMEMSSLQALVN
jgi:hypothetical protein